ncbi:uncharacterized protein K02A2.6-like [Venturia canescens]|uniref:uncharacterized protein K02A2.6-like n=1 Tax=Venturia canescens TaxID=32260 RepID=UPI001C9D4BFA|nr:uncharacterized protein K02A2.6-like [Venturia canescens]
MVLERSSAAGDDKQVESDAQSDQTTKTRSTGMNKKDGRTDARDKDSATTKTMDNAQGGVTGKITPAFSTLLKRTPIAELRERLEALGLSIEGKKNELITRLEQYEEVGERDNDDDKGGVTEAEREEEDDASSEHSDAGESDESEDEKKPVRYGKIRSTQNKRRERRTRSSDESEEERSGRDYRVNNARRRRQERHARDAASLFTIKDVEGSISHFSGDNELQIERWIDEFEDMAMLLQWSDLQKVIYAKRLLKGSAKQYIALKKGLTTWKLVKRRLIKEFETKMNSAWVHAQLSKRKRFSNETPRQYVYAMSTIANQGDVEEEAVMQYVIDGIQDDEASKSILYSACTIEELRKNLERYDRMKEKTGGKTRKEQDKNKSKTTAKEDKRGKQKGEKDTRCFVCGSDEHLAWNCPNKDDGPKCFKCNKFGHIAAKCDGRGKAKDDNAKSVNVVTQMATDNEIIVELNDVKLHAMIDTGTENTLLRYSEYEKVGSPKLQRTANTFEGFGSARVKAVGVFRTTVKVYGDEYDGEIYVIPDYAMNHVILVGKKFTRQMEVIIRGGYITITKLIVNKLRDDDTKRTEKKETDEVEVENGEDDAFRELRFVNLVEARSLDVDDRYRAEIERFIENHVPKKEVVTDVETKITLQDDTPVKDGVIQPSKSTYSSPAVIVPKKNGEYRVCVDYRQLNKKITRDRFPMPLIDDRIDALANEKVFSVLDLKNGFFHVPVAPESRKYTSFVTPDGQYEFTKTPFGLCNSPTSFLRSIDEVFRDLIRRSVVFRYVDDLIVPGKDEEEALANLKETLTVAAERGLCINWKKCSFLKRRVEYLGHVIEGGTVGPSPTKIKAVKNFPRPTMKKSVQSFLGLTGYFRKFVRDYSKIAKPLSELLKNNQRFRFEEEEERSFERLKQILTSEPVLRIYRPDAETELHTDASKEGYGAALLQKGEDDEHFHAVYFTSRKTSDAEKKLHSYELEALAVIQAVKKLRVYLLGMTSVSGDSGKQWGIVRCGK